MDFNLTPELQAFQDEVRAFLDENLPPESERDDMFRLRWAQLVREKRWIGFGWPEDVGGGGASVMQQAILKEELTARRAPPLGSCVMGLAWVGPAVVQYGTKEQKRRFIPDILDSQYQWCTGFSEPGYGSDLASLQCRAVRDGDEYVVTGQKTWTSIAMWAKWMILLVRTSTHPEKKHEGITCLLVEMDTPGITVRPIREMAGIAFFGEVFFDEARVPVANRLGKEGQGWQVTVSSLAHERSGISEVATLKRKLDALKDLARQCTRNGRPAAEDPRVRRRLAEFETQVAAMRFNGLRFLSKQVKGEPLGSETSINKMHLANLEKGLAEYGLDLQGSYGALDESCSEVLDGGRWQRHVLNWGVTVIGGGTPNIQKNIISERILGLPHD